MSGNVSAADLGSSHQSWRVTITDHRLRVLIQLSLFKEPPLFLHFHIHDPLFPVVSSISVYPGSDTLPPLTIPPHISRIPLSNVSMGPTPGSVTTLANRRKWLVIAGLAHHNLELRPWLIHSVTPRSLWFLSSLAFIFHEYTGFVNEIDLRFSKGWRDPKWGPCLKSVRETLRWWVLCVNIISIWLSRVIKIGEISPLAFSHNIIL